MFDRILSGLTVVRHAVAITLVMSAATATVASSIDVAQGTPVQATIVSTSTTSANTTTSASASTTTVFSANTVLAKNTNTSDLEATIKACLATKDAQSVDCVDALDKSGLSSEDFWAKLAFSLSDRVAKSTEPSHEPKPETARPVTGELLGLVTACVESHERSSEACAKALTQSGLTPDEFYAKMSALFQHNDPKTEPSHSTKPETKSTDEAVGLAVKMCLARFEAYRAGGPTNEPISTSDVCVKAYEATGLSPEQFWAKFAPKPVTTPKPSTTPRTEPKPTTKPVTTPSVSTAQLEVLVKDCFAKYLAAAAVQGANGSGTIASEACHTAIAASGLSSTDFWAKFGTPTSPR